MVSLAPGKESISITEADRESVEAEENLSAEFDVIIRIFGFNETMLVLNPALLLNRDSHYEGQMKPYYDSEELIEETTEGYEEPINNTDFEPKDKIIEVGQRQEGNNEYLLSYTYICGEDSFGCLFCR